MYCHYITYKIVCHYSCIRHYTQYLIAGPASFISVIKRVVIKQRDPVQIPHPFTLSDMRSVVIFCLVYFMYSSAPAILGQYCSFCATQLVNRKFRLGIRQNLMTEQKPHSVQSQRWTKGWTCFTKQQSELRCRIAKIG